MTTTELLIQKYGNPEGDIRVFEARSMILWDVDQYINAHIPAVPNKIFCNKDLVAPLRQTLLDLISLQLYGEIKTWDGCYNVRKIRGSNTAISLHSFGLAVDINASHNPMGLTKDEARQKGLRPFSEHFDLVWRDNGFRLGIDFKRKDGMHREIIPL